MRRNKKALGISAEREVVEMFWKAGGAAIRIAGSGSIRKPSADVVAFLKHHFVVEVKKTKNDFQYMNIKQMQDLKDFSVLFDANPIVAVKFDKVWKFFDLDDVLNRAMTAGGKFRLNVDEGHEFMDMFFE